MRYDTKILAANIIPEDDDLSDLLNSTSITAGALIEASKSHEKELSKLSGFIDSCLINAELYHRIALFLEQLDFNGIDYTNLPRQAKKEVITNVRNVAACFEYSYHLLNKLFSLMSDFTGIAQLDSDQGVVDSATQNARQRADIFDYCRKKGIEFDVSQELASILQRKTETPHTFYDKQPVKILINGVMEVLFNLKKLELEIEENSDKTKLKNFYLPVAQANFSTMQGLELASGMYSDISGLIISPQQSVRMTDDTIPENSRENTRNISFLMLYAYDLINGFSPKLDKLLQQYGLTTDEVTNLGMAEEVGPGPLRRRISHQDKSFNVILWRTYEGISEKQLRKYHKQNRFNRYDESEHAEHVLQWCSNIKVKDN